MIKRAVPVIIVVVLAVAIGLGWRWYDRTLAIKAPRFPTPTQTTWLQQNWSAGQRNWFHHADQGTLTFKMPYEWFVALDRPDLLSSGRLSDPAYLDRFGFIPDPTLKGPGALPVGFARGGATTLADGAAWRNPKSGEPFTSVGLTCAACHTGRLTYRGHELLVDGAPALTNLGTLRHAVGVAVLLDRNLPWRFEAFQARVLGPNASPAAKAALKAQMDAYLASGKRELALIKANEAKNVEEGFGRLDALNRIGNQVFALDLDQPANYAPLSAPVHFPRIWDASWFTWVQYNGSIEQPMVRNAGEALGVAARLTLSGPNTFASSVKVDEIARLEEQLAGATPPTAATGFTGLRPPRWSETPLPAIRPELAAQGAALYTKRCQGCHMPPTSSPEFWASSRWTPPNAAGERYLDVELIGIDHIGTDPAQAAGMANRTVRVPAELGIKGNAFGPALGQLVEKVVGHWYDRQQPPTPADQRERMDGFRQNGIQAPLKYKVRPLDGIWAAPPYLHNGSVPTLYALLSPVKERPSSFYLGNREYDPVNVGYLTGPFKNGFRLDTTIPGNSNQGHEFSDAKGPGVIGPRLSEDQRRALIEYLKTL